MFDLDPGRDNFLTPLCCGSSQPPPTGAMTVENIRLRNIPRLSITAMAHR